MAIEVPLPAGAVGFDFQVDAEVGADRDQVFRIVITDREDGSSRGIPIRAILGDPKSSGYQTFKAGVLQLAELLPPNSNSEPTPADKDPIPEPFDSAYNVPEHDAFDNDVKYVRDDRVHLPEHPRRRHPRARRSGMERRVHRVSLSRPVPEADRRALQGRSEGQAYRRIDQGGFRWHARRAAQVCSGPARDL